MDSEQINLLNSLKGAPACILWALVFHGKALDRNQLIIVTGYKSNTVTKGLRKLEELDLVEREGRYDGWQLTSRIDQFDLPGLYLEESPEEDEDGEAWFDDEVELEMDQTRQDIGDGRVLNPPSRDEISFGKVDKSLSRIEDDQGRVKIPASQITASTAKVNNSASPMEGDLGKVKRSPSAAGHDLGKVKNSPSPVHSVNDVVVETHPPDSKRIKPAQRISTTTTTASENPGAEKTTLPDTPGDPRTGILPGPTGPAPELTHGPGKASPGKPSRADLAENLDPKLLRTFRSVGLMLTPRTRAIALLPHVTPRYVRAHFARLKADGLASHTGLLITILEAGLPAPETYPNGHLATCTCDECSYRYRYKIP